MRISKDEVQEILRLGEQYDAAFIARKLDLSRLQVAAILAHHRLQRDSTEPPSEAPHSQNDSEASYSSIPEEVNADAGVRFPEEELSGIYIGDEDEFDDVPVMWDPANARLLQNPHLMIMGESGSGKTYAQQCLVAELANSSIPSIIFDYGQSFERDKLERLFVKRFDPQEYLIGEEGLALNPLEIVDRDLKGPVSVATRVADVFDAVFHLGDIQKKVLIDAIIFAYQNAGITVGDVQSWRKPPPTMADLHEQIDHLAADRQNYPQHKNAAGLSARLTTFFMLVSFRSGLQPWSWANFTANEANRVHILQFRGLEGKTQRVLVELLLWHFFFHFKTEGQQGLRLFCVLDEAHHLSFRENGPLTSLLREARKFGLGVIFASQQPEDFSSVAYSNTASKLVFQTSDPTLKVSKFLVAKSSNYERPENVRDIISRLEQGRAFFISRNRGCVVQIADFAKRSTFWSFE